jgi:hypothetical protein
VSQPPQPLQPSGPPAQQGQPSAQPQIAHPVPQKRRITRVILVVIAGATALLCVGVVGVALLLFRETTEPDRSTPDVVVFQYVRALLNDRNEVRARELTCDGNLGPAQILAFRDEIDTRQRELDVEISTTALNPVVDIQGKNATVLAELRRSALIDGRSQILTDSWQFTLEDRNGWHVCGAVPGG